MSKVKDIIVKMCDIDSNRTILYLNFSNCKFSTGNFKNTNKFQRFCNILHQTSAFCGGGHRIYTSLKETAIRKETGANVLVVRTDIGKSLISKNICRDLPRNVIFRIIFNKIKCQNQK